MNTIIACRRGGNSRSQKYQLKIPFDKADEVRPGSYFLVTEKAYGFRFNGSQDITWIPKSQIDDFLMIDDPPSISFWCPQWLIEDKALEAFIDTSYEPNLFE